MISAVIITIAAVDGFYAIARKLGWWEVEDDE